MATDFLNELPTPRRVYQHSIDSATTPDAMRELAADGNRSPQSASDAFWVHPPIDLSRWDKLYPYQLLVVKSVAGQDGETSFTIQPGWQFTLPMPPESYSISMPVAVTTSATLGGILEEHNGAPFRDISLEGSMGVLPGRAAAAQQMGFSIAETIAGGTVAQLRRVEQASDDVIRSIEGTALTNPNVHLDSEFPADTDPDKVSGPAYLLAKSTGWYQMKQLNRFIERYLSMKKTKTGRDLHLAFAAWKDQEVYLVTPAGGGVSKSAASPMELRYSLRFKAWRRINLEAGSFEAPLNLPVRRDPNQLTKLLNQMNDARRVLQGVSKLASAAMGDAERLVFEPLRESVLFCKDALGVGMTLADLPDSVVKRTSDAWVNLQGELDSFGAIAGEKNDRVKSQLSQGAKASGEVADMTSARATRARVKVLGAHPARKPFEAPKANFDTMDKTPVSKLQLPTAVTQQVRAERRRVSALRRPDFEVRRDQVRVAADRLAVALGVGHPAFEETYGITAPRLKREPTEGDWQVLFALENAITALDALAATADGEPSRGADRITVMGGLARRSGIAFTAPRSKFAVPFPYGSTLEQLARQYLGDESRWHEIAALNGLKHPYVDEVGFDLPLLVNGAENTVVVSSTENLYVGQTAFVWSSGIRRVRRHIVGLRPVGSTLVVTLDGPADLGAYLVADSAKLSAFLPDTVNSQGLIYIPSQSEPADDNAITKDIPGVDAFDPMVAVGGVDLLLDSNNDLVLTPDGDCRLAIGLTNIVQTLRIALSVRQGTLPRHPDYGLPVSVGDSTADVPASGVLAAVRRMLSEDTMFSRVDGIRVVKNAGGLDVDASFVVAGTSKPIPVSYQVRADYQAPTAVAG